MSQSDSPNSAHNDPEPTHEENQNSLPPHDDPEPTPGESQDTQPAAEDVQEAVVQPEPDTPTPSLQPPRKRTSSGKARPKKKSAAAAAHQPKAASRSTRKAPASSNAEEIPIGVQAAEATAAAADPVIPRVEVAVKDLEVEIHSMRSQVAAAVEELEVEVRNHAGTQPIVQHLAADTLRLIRENVQRATTQTIEPLAKLVRENLSSDYLDPDFWRGVGMVLQYQVEEVRGFIQRRIRGEYQTDAYGMDQEIVEVVRPFAGFLYRRWWRVTCEGLMNVPEQGRALLVANHAGLLPWDGAMLATGLLEEHPGARLPRVLHDRWMASTPLLAPTLTAVGQVPALLENAARLLEEDQLVCVFPEDVVGASRRFFNRYKLTEFGNGEYLQVAVRAGAPIIPVAIFGVEEAYPLLADAWPLARLFGMPFFPITPFFPWLGPFGMIPVPSKWTIVFLPPIDTASLGPDAADDPQRIAQLNEQVRDAIQTTLNRKLKSRRTVLFG
jgi:1-acyl-sn-glycerol-3-phosphate acyltransferase